MLVKECELELRDKGEMVGRLQTKAAHISHILTNLEQCPNPSSPPPPPTHNATNTTTTDR
jgi:hypothetical protein